MALSESKAKWWLAECACVAVLALACAAFFWDAVTLKGVFFYSDHAVQNFPYRLFFARGLQEGRLPLWTNDIFCGFPIFAESQGNACYPLFALLFGALKPWVAYNYYTVFSPIFLRARSILAGPGGWWPGWLT